jgi:hypothetical protein
VLLQHIRYLWAFYCPGTRRGKDEGGLAQNQSQHVRPFALSESDRLKVHGLVWDVSSIKTEVVSFGSNLQTRFLLSSSYKTTKSSI